jgi:ubiquitin-protein ligase E3 C
LLRYLHLLPDSLLAVASFLVQGGDDRLDWEAWRGGIASGGATASAAVGAAASASHLDDDEDEDESDPDEADRSRVRAAATTSGADARFKSSSASRLTKQDLQTLTKIDRSYHQAIRVWRTSVLEDLKRNRLTPGDAVLEQARQLCDPDEWLQWGKAVLLSRESTEDAMLAQEAYVAALAALLQSATGLKARDSVGSRFLGVLALDAAFVEHLWRYSMVQLANNTQLQSGKAAYLALSVFCDVFSHRLLAMRDDHFLRDYTTAHGRACVISAEHVIIKLRDMLYELFWTKPVRAEHVVPLGSSGGASGAADWASGTGAETRELHHEAVRGRLLLTGTKLWQSLYERWCRLVRQAPFCDEAAWWFPHVTTLSSEDAVVGRGGGGGRLLRSGVEDMDLDTSDDDDEADSESADPMSVDAVSEELAHAFSDPKMARVLTQIPQALPFERRVKLFHSLLATDKLKTQDEDADMRNAMLMAMRGEDGEWSSRERVSIRRDRLYEDSMRQLNRLGPKLRKKVQVSFINQYGQNEAGIDGGGVFKEFVDDLIKDAFSGENTTSRRLFSVTPLQTLAVNTRLPANASLLDHYEFLGRVLGKAVYESILVEPQFCLPFLNQLLGKTNSLEDLKNFDFEFYRNLTKLLVMPPEEVDGLGLTFELTLDDDSLRTHTVELVVGGRTTPVNKGNVIQYVHLVAHQRLNVESSSQTKAFLRGFRDLVPAAWVRLFSAYELQKLISGDDSIRGIDVGSLKRAMQYAAGYHPSQPIVHWFWEILEEMSAEQQRLFLRFMTSCSRQPLLGFASMEPAPCIQQIRLPEAFSASVNADKNAPLPTSSTCMNLLKLPNYWSKELMRRKLLAAIESGAGFELT